MKSFFSVLTLAWLAAGALAGELQEAADRGDIEKVRSLIKANPASVNVRDAGTTALHEATRAGHLEIVKLLLANGANVNASDFSGITPLRLALGRRNLEIADFLRQNGGLEKVAPPVARVGVQRGTAPGTNAVPERTTLFSANPAVQTGRSPLPVIASNTVVARPAVTNRPPTEREMMPVNFPIHEAARVGDVEQIKFLFKNTPDLVDSTDEKGLTPLHIAAANGQFKAAEALVALRAKVNVRAVSGQTPLHIAARHGDRAIAGLLITNRAVVNVRDNFDNTPLLIALQTAESETVDNPFLAANKSGTNSMLNLMQRQYEVVNLLVAKQADVNVRNRFGGTPLTEAIRLGNEPVVTVLLRAGADPNAVEATTGTSPLHLAAGRGQAGIAQALLRGRASVDAPDARGETPLCYALREGRTNTMALLRQAGGTIGKSRALNPTEAGLVDFYERTEAMLRQGSSSDKARAVLAMNPTKADLERMFPKHAASAWKIVDELNKQIKQAFSRSMRDAEVSKEIWRIRPEPPGPVTQEWRSRGWLASDLPVLSLAVDKTGGTTRPGDYCFVNGHWVLIPPLRTIAAQVAAAEPGKK